MGNKYIGYYFNDENSPSDNFVDESVDSKFGINSMDSYAREVIQNSIDAYDVDSEEPVKVEFSFDYLDLSEIPDGAFIKNVINKCLENISNPLTKSFYKKGIEILNSKKIPCLKASDYNTTGVRPGRDEAWGYLLYDEGKSYKTRPGSAGSHGVGKKVPFLRSTAKTVFYSTYNKETQGRLFEGKTMLVNWKDENNKRKSSIGWYGKVDENESDTRNIVKPLEEEDFGIINPFFIRQKDKGYGTDVTIIGVNVTDDESKKKLKRDMICSIMDNFFVAIKKGKLIVQVFDKILDKDNFDDVFENVYKKESPLRDKNSNFSLSDYIEVMNSGDVKEETIMDTSGKNKIGSVIIHFKLGNENHKKYYAVVRNQGMKIVEYRINKANQPYTAVVEIEGEELNKKLLSLENAAHDDFITKDDNYDIPEDAVKLLKKIKDVVSNYITEKTKIDANEKQALEEFTSIINLPGTVTDIKKKEKNKISKKVPIKKKKKGDANGNEPGMASTRQKRGNTPDPKPHMEPEKEKNEKKKKKKVSDGGNNNIVLFDDYTREPFFIKTKNGYIIRFTTESNLKDAVIYFKSINSDGRSVNAIASYIKNFKFNGINKKVNNDGTISGLNIEKDRVNECIIETSKDILYKIQLEIQCREGNINE